MTGGVSHAAALALLLLLLLPMTMLVADAQFTGPTIRYPKSILSRITTGLVFSIERGERVALIEVSNPPYRQQELAAPLLRLDPIQRPPRSRLNVAFVCLCVFVFV